MGRHRLRGGVYYLYLINVKEKGGTIMNELIPEQVRMVCTLLTSTILAIVTPTGTFVAALTLASMFNVWAGMRADGVSVIRCKRFSWDKFLRALCEFMVILVVIELIRGIMYLCGDDGVSLYPVKILTYAACVIYLQNAMKNLVKAYPKNKMLWVVYLFIRCEWRKALPANVDAMLKRYEQHVANNEKGKEEKHDVESK